MSETMIFVNLPVTDLERATRFYEAIGGTVNPNFTDENAASIAMSNAIFFMLLKREFFQSFFDKPAAEPLETVGVQSALSCESREEVDRTLERALNAGGSESRPPQELGFMYARDVTDPDGNELSFVWMDPVAAQSGPPSV